MQRTLLAAALASAFAVPAFAQSIPPELKIYGRVNVTMERIETENSSNPAVPNQSNYEFVDNSSRIGFTYSKDLTAGLKAIFQIESRVNLTDNDGDSTTFSSRDSFAGLQGGFGTIRLGRTIGPVYYATYDYISMHNHDTGTSSDALLAGTVVGFEGFMDNTLWYTSPKIGNFTIEGAFSLLNETRTAGQDQPRHIGVVGAYDAGPLHAALTYASTTDSPVLGAGSDATALTFGGAYDFKFMVLGALWEMAETDAGGVSTDSNYWRISAMFPVGQHEFHLNYGFVDADNSAGAKQYTLGYNYNITKLTKVYAFYTAVDNDTNGNFVMGGSTNTIGAATGAQYTSIAVGLRHNF